MSSQTLPEMPIKRMKIQCPLSQDSLSISGRVYLQFHENVLLWLSEVFSLQKQRSEWGDGTVCCLLKQRGDGDTSSRNSKLKTIAVVQPCDPNTEVGKARGSGV